MRSFWLTLAISLSGTTWAAGVSNCAHKVKETVQPPRGWIKQAPAPSDHTIELRIGLPQPNFHVLEQHLYEISDPFHPRYGSYMSKDDVDELVAPHPDSLNAVNDWLGNHGVQESAQYSSASDWVTVRVPVSLAEQMLDTKYHVWTHVDSGDSIVRTTSYSLPENLHAHIDVVQPTTMFAQFKGLKSTVHSIKKQEGNTITNEAQSATISMASGPPVDASCNTTVTITCLKQLYNAVGFNSSATNGNRIGITGYLGQFANIADLELFFADQRPDALNSTFEFISVNGGTNNQTVADAGDEADLDTQFAFGLTHPTPGIFYSTAGSPPFIPDSGTPTDTNEPYTKWLDFILSQPNPPQTISTSYGDDEQTVPKDFAIRVCNDFAQLGARGVTLTFSSGDGGVGDGDPDPATQQCFTNDGRNATAFIPGFPASCPFVTAVGATINVPETAVFFSGGGFSNYFSRPTYQDTAVNKFLSGLPAGLFEGLFNRDGRGIPDVSAQGDNFKIFFEGSPVLIGGTSASSPTFAGFVSLLNDARISKGLPPLGFLNPLLYSIGVSGLNDITVGNNPGCGTQGFNATEGWDAITGLGTPNFGKLKDIVLNVKQ